MALVPSVDVRVATQMIQLPDSFSSSAMYPSFWNTWKLQDELMTVRTGLSVLPVLLGGPNNPLSCRNGTVQNWPRAGAGWLLGQAEMLFGCAQQREWSWKPKREGPWASKGEDGLRSIFISLILYSLLLVRKTFLGVLLPCWCSCVSVTAFMREKQTVLNLSGCCCGHGLYLLYFCLSHCFTVHLAEFFIQNNVLGELCAGNIAGRH